MTDTPILTLAQRIGTVHDMMQYILKDPENEIDSFLWGALSGVEMILRQAHDDADELFMDEEKAKDAFKAMIHERKPDAPVMCGGEPIRNLEKELIAVMRETTKQLEDVASTGRDFLNDIDERDKAVVNGAPGGES